MPETARYAPVPGNASKDQLTDAIRNLQEQLGESRPSSLPDNEDQLKEILDQLWSQKMRQTLNKASESSADGSYDTQYQIFFRQLDKFQHNILPSNQEHSGLTFITRPKLNLQNTSLRQSRMLVPLMTASANSMAFAIRAYLDTKLSKSKDYVEQTKKSPFIDPRNPFFVPLCNGLQSISGFPDPYIQTHTTEPGFHNEDQTFVIGGDNMNKTYDLSLSFKDVQYGPIATIFMAWIEYMRLVTKGLATAYKEDIDLQRINYTVSIYRFVMDPTRKFITRYAKCVGCFPKSVPYGAMMTVNEGETFVNNIGQFTIPFTANKVVYDDYAILDDFNRLVRKYLPPHMIDSDNPEKLNEYAYQVFKDKPEHNFHGIPYVEHTKEGIRLRFIDESGTLSDAAEQAEPASTPANIDRAVGGATGYRTTA